jgi:enterochelin esterase-like enzyme
MASKPTYTHGPDSQRQAGVPQGEIHHFQHASWVYPAARRDYWVYVPQQYDPSVPAALMVFQDGHAYLDERGPYRVPIVFDNLIHAGDMPVTVAVLINPGHIGAELPENAWRASNRSLEYDTVSDRADRRDHRRAACGHPGRSQ